MNTRWSWLRMWRMGFPPKAIEEANTACDLIWLADRLPPGVLMGRPESAREPHTTVDMEDLFMVEGD